MNYFTKGLREINNKRINGLVGIFFTILVVLVGCNEHSNSSNFPTQNDKITSTQTQTLTLTLAPTSTQAPTVTMQTELPVSDAAKIAADFDDTGASYFIVYDYDASNYLVSAYENQQGTGNYSGGGLLYLINKVTGEVDANAEVDLDEVDFSKYLTVYSKLSSKIIE
jgi:hypothetical protein